MLLWSHTFCVKWCTLSVSFTFIIQVNVLSVTWMPLVMFALEQRQPVASSSCGDAGLTKQNRNRFAKYLHLSIWGSSRCVCDVCANLWRHRSILQSVWLLPQYQTTTLGGTERAYREEHSTSPKNRTGGPHMEKTRAQGRTACQKTRAATNDIYRCASHAWFDFEWKAQNWK